MKKKNCAHQMLFVKHITRRLTDFAENKRNKKKITRNFAIL